MSLQTKVTVAIIAIVISLTTVLSYLAGWKSSEDSKSKSGAVLLEVALQMSSRLDQYMWGRAGEVRVLSELTEFREAKDRQETERLIRKMRENFPAFSWIGVTDTSGRVWAGTDGILVGQSLASRPVFKEGIKGEFIGDVHDAILLANLLPNPTGEPMKFVDISMSIKDHNGNINGVLAAHMSWNWAAQLEKSMFSSLKQRNQEDIFIVSANDNTVLLGQGELLGRQLTLESVAAAKRGETGWLQERWPDGKEYLVGYCRGEGYMEFPGLHWTVLVRQPTEVAFASAYKLQIFIWLTGLIGALIFGLIGRTMARSLSQPLANMAKLADRLRFGEKNIRFDHKGVIEMEMLSESLNHMVQSLTQAEDRLIKLEMIAHHDALTGLANRIGLDAFLVHAQALVERQQNMSLGILYLDLDGFKQVNDTYGHPMGDQVLIESAKRLKHCVRTEEFVARIGGDEFVLGLFLKTDKERNMIHAVGQRIITEIGKVFLLNGATINIGCSVGAAIWHPGMSIEQVMKKADDALYRVKKSGKNRLEIL